MKESHLVGSKNRHDRAKIEQEVHIEKETETKGWILEEYLKKCYGRYQFLKIFVALVPKTRSYDWHFIFKYVIIMHMYHTHYVNYVNDIIEGKFLWIL